jgi:hypothetical protein
LLILLISLFSFMASSKRVLESSDYADFRGFFTAPAQSEQKKDGYRLPPLRSLRLGSAALCGEKMTGKMIAGIKRNGNKHE